MNVVKSLIAASTATLISGMAMGATYVVALTGTPGATQSAGITRTVVSSGIFEDTYTFAGVAGSSLVNGQLTAFIGSNGDDIDLTSVTLNGVALSFVKTPYLGNPDGRERALLGQMNFNGPLTLVVKGVLTPSVASASPAATYNASFNITQAVPEPETYALMAAGLLVVAWVARRRGGRG